MRFGSIMLLSSLWLSSFAGAAQATSGLGNNSPENRSLMVVVNGVSQPASAVYDLQCVPFARAVSGINIFGDAHLWWGRAEGRYQRGNRPAVGAVMSFPAHGSMRLGHVAAVSRIIDSRTVLISHSNWSPINGRRGQIERNVRAIDVSDNNDWSKVRVWYGPTQSLGTTHFPLNGFIYPVGVTPPRGSNPVIRTAAGPTPAQAPRQPASTRRTRLDADFIRAVNRADDPIGELIDRVD